ncbi:MAG: TcfC E-set like domain-containing protein [Gammaproteobacteria bacterium]
MTTQNTQQTQHYYDLNYSIWCLVICAVIFSNNLFANNNREQASEEFIEISNNVPFGFEDLAGPQINQVDVYYQGRFLIAAEATYDFETLEFHHPEVVIDSIDNLLDKQYILENIKGPLNTNAKNLCLAQTSNIECGVLSPNVVGIIFDEGKFKVDLFINERYVEIQYVELSKYLPAAEDSFSTIHNFSLNLSGTDAIEDRFNAQTNSIFAFGDSRILAQSNYTDDEDFLVDEISLQKDYQGWEAETGVFESESRSTNFFSQVDITGFRIQTSLNTRTDIDTSNGTDIFIFLNVRSRVEVFRNNRLIDARFYNAGNRQLDTSRFPDGAYQISIRIREENGSERTEEYFFVRNSLLPPVNDPIIYAEIGKINELQQDTILPKTSSETILHVGGAFRFTEHIALEGEFLNAGSQTMLQTGIVHVGSGVQSQLNIMGTSESDWALSIRENFTTNHFSFNMDYRHVSLGDDDIAGEDEFDLVTNDSTQATASVVHDLFGGRVFWRYRHLDLSNSEKSETYSANYRRQLIRKNHYQLDWDLSASKDTNDYLIGTRLEFSFRKNNNIFRLNSGIQSAEINDSRDNDFINSARWQHTRRDPRFGRIQSQLFHIKERDFNTAGVNLSSESRYGYNEIELNRTSNSQDDTFGYSIRSQLSLASDFKTASLGGAQRNNSAIIIDLEGQPKGAIFEVYIDRQSVGFASVGKTTVIPLSPYQTYDVRLQSRADAFLNFDESSREVTLYPGNVNTLSWDVDRVLVLIGQVFDPKGVPIKHAKINNAGAFSGTDDRGWFQIESSLTNQLTLKKDDGVICTVSLGEIDNQDDIHVFEKLVCQ